MVVVMQERATEDQIQNVIDRLIQMGFDVHRSTGTTHNWTVTGQMDGLPPGGLATAGGQFTCP